ncbi:MAG: hypothetical protein LH628_04075 [Microcoleus sp. CAN_BIN18]|nr:hypothetical protein [Microcoleus sp. CAN_BIN18]
MKPQSVNIFIVRRRKKEEGRRKKEKQDLRIQELRTPDKETGFFPESADYSGGFS